ncbi:MAG: hypothetical protein KIS92_16565 [Planctomycetota bacterium]|nr:hypothetical protein [Planctomycetota bacterium]
MATFWVLILSGACALVQMHCRECNTVSLDQHLPCSAQCSTASEAPCTKGDCCDRDHHHCPQFAGSTAIGARSQQQASHDLVAYDLTAIVPSPWAPQSHGPGPSPFDDARRRASPQLLESPPLRI